MFYYQHHIGDFIKDTANLDDHQLATYLRMMWIYYTDETPFDDDPESIAFAVRSDEKTVRLLLKHFFDKSVDKWHHNRCDREIDGYKQKSEKARGSANARWSNAKAMRTHNERTANEPVLDANQEPNNLITKKPITKDKTATRGARLPANWKPDSELAEWSKTERPDLDLRKVFAEFTDYWNSVAGGKGVKLDWNATWRNWVRSQKVEKQSFAQQSADVVRNTVAISPSYDSALRQIELDRKTAVPMPADIRAKINAVLRKA